MAYWKKLIRPSDLFPRRTTNRSAAEVRRYYSHETLNKQNKTLR